MNIPRLIRRENIKELKEKYKMKEAKEHIYPNEHLAKNICNQEETKKNITTSNKNVVYEMNWKKDIRSHPSGFM